MQEAKEEVRSRLNIEDVIGEYIQLKRAGRNFKGLSPFTSEKTPSFFVSPDKQIWHDFSSNKGGDVFAFVMEVEGLDFRASLEHLAHKAGVDLSMFDNSGDKEIAKLKKRLLEANALAVNYYQQSLVKNKHAIEYVFKSRGFNKQIVQDFKIGYAPDNNDALVQFLKKRGFSDKELAKSGLTNRFGGDLFRGRVTISLMDTTGRVIGFTGRIINDIKNAPKYLNTPQTVIYDKSRHVFGLSQAKEAIRHSNYAVIVEGNLDVVSSHQAGVKQVIATAGTAITEYHLKAIARLTSDIRLAFDNDSAGINATERAIAIAQNVGVDLSIISLPGAFKDPDELIKKDAKKWQEAIEEAKPAVDWLLKQYSVRYDLKTAAGKRNFTNAALTTIAQLNDSVEKEHYTDRVAEYVDTNPEVIKNKLQENGQSKKAYKKVNTDIELTFDPFSYQDNLLSVGLADISTRDLFKNFPLEYFEDEVRQEVAKYIASSNKIIKDTPKELQKHDTYVKILLLKADARYASWNDSDRYFETARLLRQVTNEHKKKQKIALTNQLRDAETVGDEEKADKIRIQINELIKEIQSGQR